MATQGKETDPLMRGTARGNVNAADADLEAGAGDGKPELPQMLVAGFTVEGRQELNFFFLHWMMVLFWWGYWILLIERHAGTLAVGIFLLAVYTCYLLISCFGCCSTLDCVHDLAQVCCCFPFAHSLEKNRLEQKKKKAAAAGTDAVSMA